MARFVQRASQEKRPKESFVAPVRRSIVKLRIYLAAAGLAVYAALHGAGAVWFTSGSMRFCAAVYALGCAVGAFGLLRRTFWARRYAMGVGLAGLLNCAAYFGYFRELGGIWFGGAQLAAFVGIFALLMGKKMRAHFDDLAPHWQFDHPTMHLLAAALSLNVAGIAMLVYYACLEGVGSDGLRVGSLATAALLAIGSVSAARGRILGLFLMTVAGGVSLWLGWQAVHDMTVSSQWETFKSVLGFLTAAIGSLLCFGVFLGPMVRFLRNR